MIDMMLRAILAVLVTVLGVAVTTGPVYAIGACDSYLCMAGMLDGIAQGPGCAAATQAFFAINIYDELGFDFAATAAARGAFLGMCPGAMDGANAAILAKIIGAYGAVPGE